MNDNNALETAEFELAAHSEDCNCSDNQELVMDKIASVSYIAMLSAFSYLLLVISLPFIA